MRAFWDQSHEGRNFGDALTAALLPGITWSEPELAELFGVGSSAEAIPAGYRGYVLGTGAMYAKTRLDLSSAKVLAVRGALTAKAAGLSDVLLADLGLLAPDLYGSVLRDVAVGWMPHYVDDRDRDGLRIDVLADPDEIVARASRCERIVTSSLHGLILADALGIPSMWDPHPGVEGKGFKFRDYASSFGETIKPHVWRQAPVEKVAQKQAALRQAIRSLPRPRAVFLVPRRDDNGHRDRLWAWCKARWQRYFPDVAIYEGHHDDGPFNRSAGINRAAALADQDGPWEVGIVIDSDVFLTVSQVRQAIDTARRTGKVTWAHTRWREFHEEYTKRTLEAGTDFGPELDSEDMDVLVQRTNPLSWSCCIAIPRVVWDDLGGFDERFRGWGWEDMAFASAVMGLYDFERLPGDVYNLWHPRSPDRIVKGQPRSTASESYVGNARLGRRYMIALRRDHGKHERLLPSDPDEMARDIDNLLADERSWAEEARRHGMPDWSGWWPTLEELRDSAKAFRADHVADETVTLVVHSGGPLERWEARSAYLRKSLASLAKHVNGPIVQRVLYSDWPAEVRPELDAIAQKHGLYVVGGGNKGYTESRRALWSYLSRRAVGSYVFATEDDFLYERDVDLAPMIRALDADRSLLQVALLRDPYPSEVERGGILGWPADQFTPAGKNGDSRLEHRLFFTANPSLFRRELTEREWPGGTSSERRYGDYLLRDTRARFALWGSGEAWTTHIGKVRAGDVY